MLLRSCFERLEKEITRKNAKNSWNRCSNGQNLWVKGTGPGVYSNLPSLHTPSLLQGGRRRRRKRRRRKRRRNARGTIDKSVSTARSPIACARDAWGDPARTRRRAKARARLTRCLYRGMYNNRLRRWHRYPFVSVGGHLGFSSRGRIRAGPRNVEEEGEGRSVRDGTVWRG